MDSRDLRQDLRQAITFAGGWRGNESDAPTPWVRLYVALRSTWAGMTWAGMTQVLGRLVLTLAA